MENPRTDSARLHDDRAVIDAAEEAPETASRAGGRLAQDLATRDELASATDPDADTRATKQTDIDNDAAHRSDRARGA